MAQQDQLDRQVPLVPLASVENLVNKERQEPRVLQVREDHQAQQVLLDQVDLQVLRVNVERLAKVEI